MVLRFYDIGRSEKACLTEIEKNMKWKCDSAYGNGLKSMKNLNC